MAPAPSGRGAVSEYEHLTARHAKLVDDGDNSDDYDFIPKYYQDSATNINNNNRGVSKSDLPLFTNEFFSTKSVPQPLAWSPGLSTQPSIFLTPQKSSDTDGGRCILEPHDTNQIPVPTAWSPGMIVKPNPSLLVTPDKSSLKHPPSVKVKDNFAKDSDTKENFDDNIDTLKNKGKYSVRFDLPSLSSGDETGDSTSPITLKGCDIVEDSNLEHPDTPQWKLFNQVKSYDPNAYSDESALDDSLLFSGQDTLKTFSSPEDSCTLVQAQQTQEIPNNVRKSSPTRQRKTLKKNKSGTDDRTRKSIVSSQQEAPRMLDNLKSKKQSSRHANAGPHFLKTELSHYEKNPPPKPSIIRESKNKHEETDYSYPFDANNGVAGESEFEHTFARPEFNSTLRVRSEVDEAKAEEVDVGAALVETLTKSESRRTEMNEKVS